MRTIRVLSILVFCGWSLLLAQPARGQSATPAEVKREMITAFSAKDYPAALRAAKHLYALTKQPTVLVNIARCHDLLQQVPEAIAHYRRFVKASPNSSLAGRVQRRLDALYASYRKTHREVELVTNPGGAQVTINGSLKLTTPATRWLKLGPQRIVIEKPGFKQLQVATALQSGKLIVLAYDLTRQESPRLKGGLVSINCPVKDAKVYADGKLLGLTPLQGQTLPAGKHRLRIDAPGYRAWSTRLAVEPGKHTRVDATLQPLVMVHKSSRRPMSPYRVAAWSTLGIGVGVLATAVTFSFLAKKKSTDANTALTSPPPGQSPQQSFDAYDSKFNSAKRFTYVSYGLYGVGGALLVSSVVLFFIKPKREQLSRFQFAPTLGPGHVGVHAQLRF